MTSVVVNNETGLHARPASAFVHLAKKYTSSIQVIKDGKTYDGKSIMSIMMAIIIKGDRIQIHADGEDAEIAEQEMIAFVRTLKE